VASLFEGDPYGIRFDVPDIDLILDTAIGFVREISPSIASAMEDERSDLILSLTESIRCEALFGLYFVPTVVLPRWVTVYSPAHLFEECGIEPLVRTIDEDSDGLEEVPDDDIPLDCYDLDGIYDLVVIVDDPNEFLPIMEDLCDALASEPDMSGSTLKERIDTAGLSDRVRFITGHDSSGRYYFNRGLLTRKKKLAMICPQTGTIAIVRGYMTRNICVSFRALPEGGYERLGRGNASGFTGAGLGLSL
jgi:hypothetical protein